ncbi:hypothetical protein [Clostridium sp. UBA1353]|uniref:hypothetical protein n=1 Tax=Clostridium sp. UBA1353 TaxID=1946347 RepID=UPI0032164EA6
MKVLDLLQDEIREASEIKQLETGEYQLTYNNEVVKRKRYEFRELDKVYKCNKGFALEVCDGDGFSIDGEYNTIPKDSLWVTPEDEDYRLIGGEIRLENVDRQWIEITKETLNEHFKEV